MLSELFRSAILNIVLGYTEQTLRQPMNTISLDMICFLVSLIKHPICSELKNSIKVYLKSNKDIVKHYFNIKKVGRFFALFPNKNFIEL